MFGRRLRRCRYLAQHTPSLLAGRIWRPGRSVLADRAERISSSKIRSRAHSCEPWALGVECCRSRVEPINACHRSERVHRDTAMLYPGPKKALSQLHGTGVMVVDVRLHNHNRLGCCDIFL